MAIRVIVVMIFFWTSLGLRLTASDWHAVLHVQPTKNWKLSIRQMRAMMAWNNG